MRNLIFFYGTLMSGLGSPDRTRLDPQLRSMGRGWISATLFDLRHYPAAIPAPDRRVWGELNEMLDPIRVLRALDEFEGFAPSEPDTSLYVREKSLVTLEDGAGADAWVYFYNAQLGWAERIECGDYLAYLGSK